MAGHGGAGATVCVLSCVCCVFSPHSSAGPDKEGWDWVVLDTVGASECSQGHLHLLVPSPLSVPLGAFSR